MELGAFQFENLIRNRVPFVLIHVDGAGPSFGPSFDQKQMQKLSLICENQDQVLQKLADFVSENPNAINSPLVFVAHRAQAAKLAFESSGKFGFANAFWVAGGWQALVDECFRS